ncbi:cation:proton antiporter [Haloprofundus halobius]|uniref:cation:proton antiporter domain-containing protein n=1 Tax=Haloprofundus halobius TaxID=2876194 RepID=UPI001CCEE188|nr:cation:proton antiporter [Haloprofundus halobius]
MDPLVVPGQTVIEPLGHDQLLWLFVMLTTLLVVARGLGELAKRFDLPAVVGELTAGIVLGPSLFDVTTLVSGAVFAPGTNIEPQFHLIEVVSWIGLLMLIILTGLETDLRLIVSRATESTIISITSIVVPFVIGFAFAWYLPVRFVAQADQRLAFALFVAVAMSISAIPVIAKILMDMDAIRRDFGQISLAAGMINDTVGWILLALVAGLARTGQIELASTGLTILYLTVFLLFGFTVGQRLVRWLIRWVDNVVGGQVAKITTVMVLSMGVGSFTHYLHLEVVLGAFVVGILVGQVKRFDYETEHTFEMMTMGVFAPIFFATAGLRVDLTSLFEPVVFFAAIGALLIAVVGKFVGSYVGAKAAGLSHWEGITMGAGLNARGAMEIIVAMVGLGLGVLTVEMYSIIVMIAIVTSLMAPPLLRWSLPKVPMSDAERERLEREKRQAGSFLGSVTTILLPTRCSGDSQFAAQLLGRLTRDEEIEVTNMYLRYDETERSPGRIESFVSKLPYVGSDEATHATDGGREDPTAGGAERSSRTDTGQSSQSGTGTDGETDYASDSARCLNLMQFQLDPGGDVSARNVVRSERGSATEAVLTEAERDYDMLVLGASERGARPDDPLFGSVVDEVVQNAPCPVMVVNADPEASDGILEQKPIRRILLPTVGAEYNRHAAEVAFAIAGGNTLVEVLHVVNPPQIGDRFVEEPDIQQARRIGEEIVDAEADLGRAMGVEVTTKVFVGDDDEPQEAIVEYADETGADLVLLGSNIRPVSGRAFLGHRAEYVIRNATCPVAVLSSR